jgi:hypothetical protein
MRSLRSARGKGASLVRVAPYPGVEFRRTPNLQVLQQLNFREPRTGEIRRTPLQRSRVNKGKKRKDQAMILLL